jgi:hypothetical protein
MNDRKHGVVTLSGARALSDVENALRDAGFAVDQVLDAMGCITGTASEDVAERLRAIPGIADVSPPPSADVGPPGAPVTW